MFRNKALRPYLLLWGTQSLSGLGSAMTGFALVIWLYQQTGSALETAMLSICSYAPYVLMSIFAGALSDRWDKKRTMLACDLVAAVCTVIVLALLKANALTAWHMYALNAINGLMNTVQQPAAEVAATLLIPKEYYQKTSGLQSFSSSLTTILTPALASALFAFGGMDLVIGVDLCTFAVAFTVLWGFIRLPRESQEDKPKETVLSAAKLGLDWIKGNPLILNLILFLACINLVASAYNAALPALILPRENGGEAMLGLVNTVEGLASLAGSALVTLLPTPKDRVRVICVSLMVSMSMEDFLLAFGQKPWIWCVGSVLGWISVPIMNASMDVIFRRTIPTDMQGRVFSCRNTLQFFTIPLGYFLGGVLVDRVFEPWMSGPAGGRLAWLFGTGKGSGAAAVFCVLGVSGIAVCSVFWWVLRRYHWSEEQTETAS